MKNTMDSFLKGMQYPVLQNKGNYRVSHIELNIINWF